MEERMETSIMNDAELSAAFDAAWDEEDAAEEGLPAQYDPEEDEFEEETQYMQDSETVRSGQSTQNVRTPKGETAGADQPLTFTLKHLDETRTVDRDEVVKLAQQGMDYERIRTERDQLRAFRSEADPALALVKDYAEKCGMSAAEYVNHCRSQESAPAGAGQGNMGGMLPEAKRAFIRVQQETKAAAEARRAEMGRFLQVFPGVKPEEIPRQVWDAVSKGEGLTAAYTLHRNRQLEAALAAERQNRENAQKTTGSLFAGEAGSHQSEIDRWWNEE